MDNYIEINKKSWNSRTDIHLESEFYDMENFLEGESSLKEIEMGLLGNVEGKSILHLQCHFGQDSLSLSRMGAQVTGVDLSDKAIQRAREIARKIDSSARFINCDIYDLPNHLDQTFDVVFTSYGTIGWLPDMEKWAKIVSRYLKPGGLFVFVEFHPVVWMFDDDFSKIQYNYLNSGPIAETEEGTYADPSAAISEDYVMWNHGIGEVLGNLINEGLEIRHFSEYDYSPYDCFAHTTEVEPGKFQIKHLGNKIPLVYALSAIKK